MRAGGAALRHAQRVADFHGGASHPSGAGNTASRMCDDLPSIERNGTALNIPMTVIRIINSATSIYPYLISEGADLTLCLHD